MNKSQRKIISIIVPIITIFLGFVVIGADGSTSTGYGNDGSVSEVFDIIRYLYFNGSEWSAVVLLIGLFEFFWWKTPK